MAGMLPQQGKRLVRVAPGWQRRGRRRCPADAGAWAAERPPWPAVPEPAPRAPQLTCPFPPWRAGPGLRRAAADDMIGRTTTGSAAGPVGPAATSLF